MSAEDGSLKMEDGAQQSPPRGALEQRFHDWVMQALDRVVVAPIAETDLFVARVKGYPSLSIGGRSEEDAMRQLSNELQSFAQRRLANGGTLPVFERPVRLIPPATMACVRISTLKRELKERSKSWGVTRRKLPPHLIEDILAEFDLLITRHAAAMANPD